MEPKQAEEAKRSASHRSPSYPAIPLAKAIDRAKVFYQHERRSTANVAVALAHWGYSATSGPGRTTLAAMLAYGLMRVEGANDKREVKLSDLAFRIILDDREVSPERDAALREAAMTPKIYREILNMFPRLEVSDANLKHHLLVTLKFNDNVVKDFIGDLRATVSFAKLGLVADNEALERKGDEGQPLKVGDYVRWESSGVIQFECKRVEWINGEYAGVEGSSTGLPVAELAAVSAPTSAPAPAPASTPYGGAQNLPPAVQTPPAHIAATIAMPQKGVGMRQEVFALAEGDVTIQWPERLSADSLLDFKDWLRILERKITRSALPPQTPAQGADEDAPLA